MTREEYIRELQRAFTEGRKYDINFDKFLWRGKETKRNCLCYALNLVDVQIEKRWWVDSFEELLQRTVKEEETVREVYHRYLEFLQLMGVKYKKCRLKTKVPEGYYKIAMLIETGDVHWLRQDADGTWSHKPGWKYKPQNRDHSNQVIRNPRKANIYISGRILKINYFLIPH